MSEECAIEYIAVKHGLKVPEEDVERIIQLIKQREAEKRK